MVCAADALSCLGKRGGPFLFCSGNPFHTTTSSGPGKFRLRRMGGRGGAAKTWELKCLKQAAEWGRQSRERTGSGDLPFLLSRGARPLGLRSEEGEEVASPLVPGAGGDGVKLVGLASLPPWAWKGPLKGRGCSCPWTTCQQGKVTITSTGPRQGKHECSPMWV